MTHLRRFVTWSAVSSLPQAKKISLIEQREINAKHVAHHQGVAVAHLEVPGESRDIVLFDEACERIEAYAQLRDLINNRAFDVLVCLNRSRLGRTLALVETIAELCRRAKIILYETESPPGTLEYAGDTYDNLLLGAIKSAGAQREIAEIQRRHEMGMLGKFRKGEFLAKIPYGWRMEYAVDGSRRVVIDEEAARNIRLILIEFGLGRGLGLRTTAEAMNKLGTKSPSGIDWTHNAVDKVWRMIYRYAGIGEINLYSDNGRPYARSKGAWPTIISEEEMHRLLDERTVRRDSRRAARTYIFSLMVWCAKCNSRMRMQFVYTTNKNKDGEVTSRHKHDIAACRSGIHHAGAHISISIIKRAVVAFIDRLQDRASWSPYLADASHDINIVYAKMVALVTQIGETKALILQADDHLMDGKFDGERHTRQVARLKTKIERLQHEITELEDKRLMLESINRREERLEELAAHGRRYLEMEDERTANTCLRPLIKIWIADGKVTEIEIL